MFDKDKSRYISKGVKHKISPFIYLMLWEMIEDMETGEKDCLQVFDLKLSEEEEGLQEIIHTQEKYNNSMKFYTNFGVNAKVYVIDTGESETMFLEGEL